MSGCSMTSSAGGAGDQQDRHEALDRAHPLRFAGEHVGGVEDERHLGQLGGLDLEGAAADPAGRPVDALPGAEHDDEQEDRAGEQDRRRAADRDQPVASGEVHDHQADRADDQGALQVVGRVGEAAVLQHLGGRGGGEDHHRAEGEQAERRRQQQAVLGRDRGARATSPCASSSTWRGAPGRARGPKAAHPRSAPSAATISRKRSPRASKFGKASKLAQAGREQDDLAGSGRGGGAADRVLEVVDAAQRHAGVDERRQLGLHPLGGVAEQVGGDGALAQRRDQRPERLALVAAAEDRVHAAVEAADADRGGGDVGRLGVVDEADAAELAATDSSRCGTPAKLRRPARTASRSMPKASAAAAAAIAFSTLWSPGMPSSLDLEQRFAVPEDRPGSRRHLAVGRGTAAELDPPRAAAEVDPGQFGIVAVPDRDVVVALVGEDAQLRVEVGGEVAVAVEVVGRQVQEDRALGAEEAGVLELEAGGLGDDGRVGLDLPDQAGERDADVARHRDRLAGPAEDVAEQLDRGRLAVGAGDGEEAVGQGAPGELELTGHLDPPLQSGRDHCRLPGNPRALDDRVRALELCQPIRIQDNFDAVLGKPFGAIGMPGIDRADLLATGGEEVRGGLAGAGEPDDQEGPARQRRSHFLGRDQRHQSHSHREPWPCAAVVRRNPGSARTANSARRREGGPPPGSRHPARDPDGGDLATFGYALSAP